MSEVLLHTINFLNPRYLEELPLGSGRTEPLGQLRIRSRDPQNFEAFETLELHRVDSPQYTHHPVMHPRSLW